MAYAAGENEDPLLASLAAAEAGGTQAGQGGDLFGATEVARLKQVRGDTEREEPRGGGGGAGGRRANDLRPRRWGKKS